MEERRGTRIMIIFLYWLTSGQKFSSPVEGKGGSEGVEVFLWVFRGKLRNKHFPCNE